MIAQKNKHSSSERSLAFVVGYIACGILGDKETAVRIRGNSHYRISCRRKAGQVGMLIVLCHIKVLWATWEDLATADDFRLRFWREQDANAPEYPMEGTFIFILLIFSKKERITT